MSGLVGFPLSEAWPVAGSRLVAGSEVVLHTTETCQSANAFVAEVPFGVLEQASTSDSPKCKVSIAAYRCSDLESPSIRLESRHSEAGKRDLEG